MLTLAQLMSVKDPEQALDEVLEIMRNLGFDTTQAEQDRQVGWSWQSGSFALVTATVAAKVWVFLSESISLRTKAMRNETAEDEALDWWGMSQYAQKRKASVAARHYLLLTDSKNTGPHTIANSLHVFKDSFNGVTFRNIAAGTIPLSGSVTIEVECEQAGTIGNSPNDRITQMVSSIAGVTVTNPAQVSTGNSLTRTGVDKESNVAYRRRNELKWTTLGPNAPRGAYEWFALNALDGSGNPVGITRVKVGGPNGFGAFSVYVANATATATALQVSDVQAWIDTRKNPTAQPTVVAATEVPINNTIRIVTARGQGPAAATAVSVALAAYVNSLNVGGFKLDPSGTGYVLVSELISAAMNVDGVLQATATVTTDYALTVSQVATVGALTVTHTETSGY